MHVEMNMLQGTLMTTLCMQGEVATLSCMQPFMSSIAIPSQLIQVSKITMCLYNLKK
jgi:hypothetical protein